MQLLDDPRTWIVAAAVLVVLAIVLIVSAWWRRRSRARALAAAPAAAVPTPEALPPGSLAPAPAVDDEDDSVTGPLALPTSAAAPTAPPADPVPGPVAPASADDPVVPATLGQTSADRGAPPAPEHDTDRAKDRLLALLLHDPDAAVRTVAGLRHGASADDSASSVTSLLRAGLRPAQVASLTGIGEADLADAVARDLGLLVRPQPADADRTGRNDTDAPGRSWANVGSAAGSTTPTTG